MDRRPDSSGDAFHWMMIQTGVKWFTTKYSDQVIATAMLVACLVAMLAEQRR
jgi:hypothetical protein